MPFPQPIGARGTGVTRPDPLILSGLAAVPAHRASGASWNRPSEGLIRSRPNPVVIASSLSAGDMATLFGLSHRPGGRRPNIAGDDLSCCDGVLLACGQARLSFLFILGLASFPSRTIQVLTAERAVRQRQHPARQAAAFTCHSSARKHRLHSRSGATASCEPML